MSYNPKIMGIFNITPDSFYDGNKFLNTKQSIDNIYGSIFSIIVGISTYIIVQLLINDRTKMYKTFKLLSKKS